MDGPFVALPGPDASRFPLVEVITSVGRTEDNRMPLDDPEISRHHAQFVRDGNQIWLEDLESSNGTFVNGNRISSAVRLQEGDRVEFAGIVMYFHTGQLGDQPGTVSFQTDPSLQPDPWAPSNSPEPVPALPQAALEGIDGGSPILLVKAETSLGRLPGNDVIIPDEQISARHARIRNDGGSFILWDVGSVNGTFVNGSRLDQPHVLHPGDEVTFARCSYIFRRLAPAPVRRPVPRSD